jgi:hypothetical protein
MNTIKWIIRINVVVLVVLWSALFGVSCTEQQRAKTWGGSSTIHIPVEAKLVLVTWKNDDLWILIRERKEGEKAEEYLFQESSSWGLMEGKIKIVENSK